MLFRMTGYPYESESFVLVLKPHENFAKQGWYNVYMKYGKTLRKTSWHRGRFEECERIA